VNNGGERLKRGRLGGGNQATVWIPWVWLPQSKGGTTAPGGGLNKGKTGGEKKVNKKRGGKFGGGGTNR